MNKINICQLKELSLSCIGCCGFDFTYKEDVTIALDKNTAEFQDFIDKNDKSLIDLKGFMNRHPKGILRLSGICYNLIWLDKNKEFVICPLHPDTHCYEGSDLRKEHCNPEYICKTAYQFNKWDKDKQKRYIEFIRKKNPNWYEYSIKTDNDSYFEEFESIDKD